MDKDQIEGVIADLKNVENGNKEHIIKYEREITDIQGEIIKQEKEKQKYDERIREYNRDIEGKKRQIEFWKQRNIALNEAVKELKMKIPPPPPPPPEPEEEDEMLCAESGCRGDAVPPSMYCSFHRHR